MNEHIVIVTGTSPIDERAVATVASDAIVLGVDSGLDVALAAGLKPSGLIGDLDSVSEEGHRWAQEHATVARHPTAKDQTDTELALAFATDMNPERLTMIGGGNRLDHTIAALGALGAPHLTGVPVVDAWWDGQHVDVIAGPGRRTLHLEPNSIVSLVVLGRRCENVSISGVRWALDEHRLDPVVGLGVSNEVIDPDGVVKVSVSTGVLTVFDVPRVDRPPDSSTPRSSDRNPTPGETTR